MSFAQLKAINSRIRTGAGVSPWAQSTFGWMKGFSPVARGGFGAQLIIELLSSLGYQYTAGQLAQSVVVKGKIFKIKLSMMWNTNEYVFEQVEDDPYDYLIMFGLEPTDTDAVVWVVPKAIARAGTSPQHAGNSPWIRFAANAVPPWLTPFGGSIANFAQELAKHIGLPP